MKQPNWTIAALAAGVLAVSGLAHAQMPSEPPASNSHVPGGTINPSSGAGAAGDPGIAKAPQGADAEFVDKAAMSGKAEVQASQLALKQAQSADVRAFAKRMVADHGKANAKLNEIAARKGMKPQVEQISDPDVGAARQERARLRHRVSGGGRPRCAQEGGRAVRERGARRPRRAASRVREIHAADAQASPEHGRGARTQGGLAITRARFNPRAARAARFFGEAVMAQRQSKHEGILELLCQAYETELGGAKIYEAALQCATDEDLHKEWEKYHRETMHHQEVLRKVFETLGLDPDTQSPGRAAVAATGQSLVQVIEQAKKQADPAVAQVVAAECVVLAETKDHLNWELIGYAAEQLPDSNAAKVLKAAHDEVEADEDHHLYHTRGWAREMWIESMGFKAVLPPPEEVKKVESAADAARAEKSRGKMM